jgi:hypothetical protein
MVLEGSSERHSRRDGWTAAARARLHTASTGRRRFELPSNRGGSPYAVIEVADPSRDDFSRLVSCIEVMAGKDWLRKRPCGSGTPTPSRRSLCAPARNSRVPLTAWSCWSQAWSRALGSDLTPLGRPSSLPRGVALCVAPHMPYRPLCWWWPRSWGAGQEGRTPRRARTTRSDSDIAPVTAMFGSPRGRSWCGSPR